ncbi:MAG: carboxypeptidase regulatory-like domain-containing protein, partial [Planctomycetes bacterium]|nr:carboxypeptidase regulatory-like domain-containing protein [Planctomycetota bacterium]
ALIILIFCTPFAIAEQDIYEDDDASFRANVLQLNDQNPEHLNIPGYEWRQFHNFHDEGDEDWVKFFCRSREEVYNLSIKSPGPDCDAVIEIYGSDRKTLILNVDDYGPGEEEQIEWRCTADGVYYARIRQYNPSIYGDDTNYELWLTIPKGVFDGAIYGRVTPSVQTVITSTAMGEAMTLDNGYYFMPHIPGTFGLSVKAIGYSTYRQSVTVGEFETKEINIDLGGLALSPPPSEGVLADIKANGSDGPITVAPAVLISIVIDFDPGDRNEIVDWWINLNTNLPGFEWISYLYPEGWNVGAFPTAQHPLAKVNGTAFQGNLPPGNYNFYFGVDDNADGAADNTWFDFVEVNVVE